MKKLVNYFSIAFIFALMYCVIPAAHANEDPGGGSDNHRKTCLWHGGCKPKQNKSCFGANCTGFEDPEDME